MRRVMAAIRFRRRYWWLLLAVVILLGVPVAVFFLSTGGGAPELQLVALGEEGRFEPAIAVPAARTVAATDPAAVARVPLVLAVRNVGTRPARPARLALSLPARFRLTTSEGEPLPGQRVEGNPLVRIELDLPIGEVEPGRLPELLPGVDTLWIEPLLPAFHCTAASDSVPEFVPAPQPDPATLTPVRIFYSFEGDDIDTRQTGLLSVDIDPALLRRASAPPIPDYPTRIRATGFPLPALGALRYAGHRRAQCGAPEEPVEVYTSLWETLSGGRFFVLYHGGAPRKYLFDLDRDGVIELEYFDPDRFGRFRAVRQTRIPVLPFLLPPAGAKPFDPAVFAELPPDSLARLDRFATLRANPRPFSAEPPDTQADTLSPRFRPRVFGRALTAEERALPPVQRHRTLTPGGTAPRAGAATPPPTRPRIARTDTPSTGTPPAAVLGTPVPTAPPATAPGAAQAAQPEAPAPTDRPERERPRLLGRPVPSEPTPPDTTPTPR